MSDRLRVEIHNTGACLADGNVIALADERGAASGRDSGVGLLNCRERLRLLYGASAELIVATSPAGGVTASVVLPCPATA